MKFPIYGISFFFIIVITSFEVTSACNAEEYECRNSDVCIPKSQLCNNEPNCPEKDDEEHEWCDVKQCRNDSKNYYLCKNEKTCISKELMCNQEGDCPDFDDESEENCGDVKTDDPDVTTHRPCDPVKEFQCDAKICLNIKYVCNGKRDCFDGRDETEEACKIAGRNSTQCSGFLCDDKQCIDYKHAHCDGFKDCKDGSDEKNCDCELSKGKFLCHSLDQCIDKSKLCDKVKDCTDGSDESIVCQEDRCKNMKCEHDCVNLASGSICICKEGFKLKKDGKSCEDIDECEEYGKCSQKCENNEGSYRCSCSPEYRLQNDNHTCKVKGGDAVLLYSTRKKVYLHYLASGLKANFKTKAAIGVSYDGKNAYWTDIYFNREAIFKQPLTEKKKETIIDTGIELPEDVAVDWLTGNIYFTDSSLSHIAVCSSDGNTCTILIKTHKMDRPRGIALQSTEGLMFWTDWGVDAHIGCSFMDGSGEKVLVSDVKWPNGLTIDWPSRRLYWVDGFKHTIESVTILGKDRRQILTDEIQHPYSVAVFEDRIFWSDWETESLRSCNKFNGKNVQTFLSGARCYDIHVYHESLMPVVKHGCNPNPCSHLCLLSENLFPSCACPENMELDNTGKTCKPLKVDDTYQVVIGVYSNLFVIDKKRFGSLKPKVYNISIDIDSLSYNSKNGEILIANHFRGSVHSFNLQTETLTQIFETSQNGIGSLSFDYLANNIYWIDEINDKIDIFSLNTMKHGTLMNLHDHDHGKPESIALSPSTGKMFIAYHAPGHAHIDLHSMGGGSEHEHLIEDDLLGPIYLLADEDEKKLYWVDQDNQHIEFADYDGSHREVFAGSEVKTPVTLALVDDEVYWTSRNSKSFHWQYKHGNGTVNKGKTISFSKSIDSHNYLQVVGKTPLKEFKHVCMNDNGGCSDICVSTGLNSRICLCETGHKLKDNSKTTCIMIEKEKEDKKCGFKCSSSGECLELSQKCDGKVDCDDKSDEVDCENSSEKGHQSIPEKINSTVIKSSSTSVTEEAKERHADNVTSETRTADEGSSWFWNTMFTLVILAGIGYLCFLIWKRYNHRFIDANVSMYFRNNQLFGMSRDDKPSVRTSIGTSSTQPQTSLFARRKSAIENCHEIVNVDNDYLSSASSLNFAKNDLVMQNYSDDEEVEPLHNFESTDETEKLIH